MIRPIRVTALNDKSDNSVRYDLFERLNTGGVKLHAQEIRNCVFRGLFTDQVKALSNYASFRAIVKLPENETRAAAYDECVLRFFAFKDNYRAFDTNVIGFLNDYAIDKNKTKSLVKTEIFKGTMDFLKAELPDGIVRQKRKKFTPINLYEGVAVGAALALESGLPLRRGVLKDAIHDDTMTRYTTAGTNSRSMVNGRIHFIRDALLGN